MFDLEIKLALKKGNPEAFKELFRLLYPRLRGYCKLFITENSQSDDLIQETFMSLWENREKIDPGKSIESYVFIVLRNKCLNYLRQQRLEDNKIGLENIAVNELQYLYQLDFTEKEGKSLEEQMAESFRIAVDKLPEKMRYVFIKCKIEGNKQSLVAEELGISLKAVEKYISKAKGQIREKLLKQYPALALIIMMFLD